MLQRDILPKLFNYWQDLGKVYNKSESKILAKELTVWCSNNWRMVRGGKSEKRLQIRTFEVLWKTKREIVEAEITRMKDEDGRTEPRFELRTSASKNIIKKMKEKDLKDLKAVGEQMARTGYSEEHKRRLAKRYHKRRVLDTMEKQYQEMGMTSIVIMCYKDSDGKPVVNSFDRISELMGVPSASFIDTYSAKVEVLMMDLVEYTLAMDVIQNTPVQLNPLPSGPDAGVSKLDKSSNGFPILPDPITSQGMRKTEWEGLFTDYLSQHYHLASGGKKKLIPYKCISENQKKYINQKYLPQKTIFRPPRNIGIEEIKSIFEFFLQSQRDRGPEDAFKFDSIKVKGITVPSQYRPLNVDSDSSSNSNHGSSQRSIPPPIIRNQLVNTTNAPPIPSVDIALESVPGPACGSSRGAAPEFINLPCLTTPCSGSQVDTDSMPPQLKTTKERPKLRPITRNTKGSGPASGPAPGTDVDTHPKSPHVKATKTRSKTRQGTKNTDVQTDSTPPHVKATKTRPKTRQVTRNTKKNGPGPGTDVQTDSTPPYVKATKEKERPKPRPLTRNAKK